jgi:hypothetical protein
VADLKASPDTRPKQLSICCASAKIEWRLSFEMKKMLRVLIALSFVGAAGLPAIGQAANPPLTAREVMKRIIAATGATPPENTVDTLKAGDPDTVVKGIVTTFMDTYPVLQKAAASGKNLIITHEPTFYNHRDDLSILAGDAVQAQKLAYIREHHLVVWRSPS